MRSSLRFLVAAILGLILLSGPVSAPAPQATPLTQDSTQKKAIKCMGEYEQRHLPLSWNSLVRKDEAGQIHERV
jgi:hypothetical protein